MNNKNIWLLLIAATGAGAGGGYWYASHGERATPADSPAASAAPVREERKILYWHDPMVPGQKFDKPGKSPFMDMQLVPVYAEEAPTGGGVTISPRVVQNLGIRIAEAKESRLELGFTAVGTVTVDESTLSAVQSRVNGYVERLYVRAQYDPVARGQRLADVYAPEWLSTQEEYLALKGSAQPGVSALADAARQRLALLGIPQAEIRRLEETGKASARITLYAPQAGVVWELGVRDGMAVNSGMTLFKLASLGSVWVYAEVPEAQSALVKPGTPAEARAAAFPERVFKGTIATLLPDVNATTRTVKARVVLSNPGAQLRPGMFATLTFGAAGRTALTVPGEAVIYTGQRKVVIVTEGPGKFRPVEVETGRDSGDMTEIVRGLKAGDKVVVSGQFLIDSEASLKSTLSRLDGGVAPAAAPANTDNPVHSGRGEVKAVDAAQGRVTLIHDPIPSLKWPAMTMEFRVQPPSQLAGFKPGDTVEFDFRGEATGGEYTITRILKSAAGSRK